METLRLVVGDRSKDLQIKVDQGKGSRRLRSFVSLQHLFSPVNLTRLFSSYPFLRVLILHDPDGPDPIPDEVGNLIHLRCFRLISHSLHNLPDSMENLRNLLILDYRKIHSIHVPNLMKVPNLKEMKHLMYLYLPDRIVDHNCVLNLQKLENLKLLWGISSGPWMITELPSLSPTVEKLGIICIEDCKQLEMVYQCPSIVKDCLYTLKLGWQDGAEFQPKNLRHCGKLKRLDLFGKIAEEVPLIFPPNLLKLVLMDSRIRDGESFGAALEALLFLKFLYLRHEAYANSHLTFPTNSLSGLEHLHILCCTSLEEIHVMEGAVANLKRFSIFDCNRLRVVPQCLQCVRDYTWSLEELRPGYEDE